MAIATKLMAISWINIVIPDIYSVLMSMNCIFIYLTVIKILNMETQQCLIPLIDMKVLMGKYKLTGIKHQITKYNGPVFLLMALNYVEDENQMKINDFTCSLLVTTIDH